MTEFEKLGQEIRWEGTIAKAGVERFRHADGQVVMREKVWHPGAVGILALGQNEVWLTRQPREAVGEGDSLEIPAGKLDVPGEAPLQCAKRELAEEVGMEAHHWTQIKSFYTSPGFSDERVWLYLASTLSQAPQSEPEENERIEIVAWPLQRLDQAIAECEDSKSLIGLLWLKAGRNAGAGRE